MKDTIKKRLDENLSRVENLVKFYDKTGKGRRRAHETDVLRAAIVMLHASMEDFLRSLARWKLPLTTEEKILDKFPFLGSKPGQRTEKVSLGFFAAYRGKSVDEVISISINEYLDRSNINNINELCTLIESFGINPAEVNTEFASLEKMMLRRHLIVHRADRDDDGGSGHHKVKSIGAIKLNSWIKSVREFSDSVLEKI